ncbi:hypothetical protein [Streptomyces similanensis]|uniref:Uncharacterized protein n=1 Tax=Streptomyces similanensis TaxID=1274988 RepID=A0ABP9LCD1_9ACTN
MPKAYVFTRYGGAEPAAPTGTDRARPDAGRAPAATVVAAGHEARTGRPGGRSEVAA